MTEQGYQTAIKPEDFGGQYNALRFLVKQMLANVRTAALVEVKKCTNSGGVTAVGFVDVQPLVNQVDGFGKAVPHGIIKGLPYMRLQGGQNAVILDPVIGDIGIALFADRDSSRVKTTKKQANPGSNRRFDMADGLYIGGVLNGTPAQYVEFSGAGINLVSPTAVTIKAPAVNIENAGAALLNLLNTNLLTWLAAHVHTSAAAGNPTSSPTAPIPANVQTTTLQAE